MSDEEFIDSFQSGARDAEGNRVTPQQVFAAAAKAKTEALAFKQLVEAGMIVPTNDVLYYVTNTLGLGNTLLSLTSDKIQRVAKAETLLRFIEQQTGKTF